VRGFLFLFSKEEELRAGDGAELKPPSPHSTIGAETLVADGAHLKSFSRVIGIAYIAFHLPAPCLIIPYYRFLALGIEIWCSFDLRRGFFLG
jgi:hypothetical protein